MARLRAGAGASHRSPRRYVPHERHRQRRLARRFNTDDFEGFVAKLAAHGFREDAGDDDPRRLLVKRNGLAGFPQLYLIDPDRNVIEVNGAP